MEVEHYLAARHETQAAFARRSRVAQSVLNAIIVSRRPAEPDASPTPVNRSCSTTNAYRIVRASLEEPTDEGGWVDFPDLVPLAERVEPLAPLIARAKAKRSRSARRSA